MVLVPNFFYIRLRTAALIFGWLSIIESVISAVIIGCIMKRKQLLVDLLDIFPPHLTEEEKEFIEEFSNGKSQFSMLTNIEFNIIFFEDFSAVITTLIFITIVYVFFAALLLIGVLKVSERSTPVALAQHNLKLCFLFY